MCMSGEKDSNLAYLHLPKKEAIGNIGLEKDT
jgi:hypothetical protein